MVIRPWDAVLTKRAFGLLPLVAIGSLVRSVQMVNNGHRAIRVWSLTNGEGLEGVGAGGGGGGGGLEYGR